MESSTHSIRGYTGYLEHGNDSPPGNYPPPSKNDKETTRNKTSMIRENTWKGSAMGENLLEFSVTHSNSVAT